MVALQLYTTNKVKASLYVLIGQRSCPMGSLHLAACYYDCMYTVVLRTSNHAATTTKSSHLFMKNTSRGARSSLRNKNRGGCLSRRTPFFVVRKWSWKSIQRLQKAWSKAGLSDEFERIQSCFIWRLTWTICRITCTKARIMPIPPIIRTAQNVNQDAESLLSFHNSFHVLGRLFEKWCAIEASRVRRIGKSLFKS